MQAHLKMTVRREWGDLGIRGHDDCLEVYEGTSTLSSTCPQCLYSFDFSALRRSGDLCDDGVWIGPSWEFGLWKIANGNCQIMMWNPTTRDWQRRFRAEMRGETAFFAYTPDCVYCDPAFERCDNPDWDLVDTHNTTIYGDLEPR